MLPAEVLNEAFQFTFEEMAFLDVVPGSPPQAAPAGEGPVLYLEFTRPSRGALALVLPKEVKFQVAEAIYGETRTELTALQLDDSLLELLNVLAGRLLTRRFGPGTAYSMGLPTILYDAPGDLPGYVREEAVFHVDSWEIVLIWYEGAE